MLENSQLPFSVGFFDHVLDSLVCPHRMTYQETRGKAYYLYTECRIWHVISDELYLEAPSPKSFFDLTRWAPNEQGLFVVWIYFNADMFVSKVRLTWMQKFSPPETPLILSNGFLLFDSEDKLMDCKYLLHGRAEPLSP